jgi:RNA polymerase sigma-70 factor, ECF subfamily
MTGSPAACPPEADSLLRSLYQRHGAALTAFCARHLDGDRHTAEDVVQETLVRAWRQADVLGTTGRSLWPWLVTVARRLIVDRHRRLACRPHEVAAVAAEASGSPEAIAAPDEMERVLSRIAIWEALSGLPPAHRQIIVEVYGRGRTVTEAASALGIPLGTAKSRLFHALAALRRRLDDRQPAASRDVSRENRASR